MKKHGWLFVLVVLALLVAACGPGNPTPATGGQSSPSEEPTAAATAPEKASPEPTSAPTDTASAKPTASEPTTQSGEWNVQGFPDASVTIIEYSDFQ